MESASRSLESSIKLAFRGCVFILERRGSEGIMKMQNCQLREFGVLRMSGEFTGR